MICFQIVLEFSIQRGLECAWNVIALLVHVNKSHINRFIFRITGLKKCNWRHRFYVTSTVFKKPWKSRFLYFNRVYIIVTENRRRLLFFLCAQISASENRADHHCILSVANNITAHNRFVECNCSLWKTLKNFCFSSNSLKRRAQLLTFFRHLNYIFILLVS